MARTGKPATRHVAAVERAVAVLDALAGAVSSGTNEVARRTGLNASTGLPPARDARRRRARRARRRDRPLPARPAAGRARQRRRSRASTYARSRGRTCGRSSRRPGETATLSAPGEPDAITVDFVQSASSVQSVARVGRPSVAHATATGKVALAFGDVELPPGPLAPLHRAHDRRPWRARARGRARPRAGLGTGDGRARGRPQRRSPPRCSAAAASSWPSSACRAPLPRFGEAAVSRALAPLLAHAAAVSDALGWRPTEKEGS